MSAKLLDRVLETPIAPSFTRIGAIVRSRTGHWTDLILADTNSLHNWLEGPRLHNWLEVRDDLKKMKQESQKGGGKSVARADSGFGEPDVKQAYPKEAQEALIGTCDLFS